MAWLLWLLAAAALGVAEAVTLTLALGILGGAALLAAVVAGFGAPIFFQVLAFVISALLGLVVLRPIALRHMRAPAPSRDGTDALIGRQAMVVEEVTSARGLIHLGGEDWSARAYVDDVVIPRGTRVDVMEIDGATAIVYPQDLPLIGG